MPGSQANWYLDPWWITELYIYNSASLVISSETQLAWCKELDISR